MDPRKAIEVFFLLAVLLVGFWLGRRGSRTQKRSRGFWFLVVGVSFALALGRKYIMEMDVFAQSADFVEGAVDSWDWSDSLEAANDFIYEYLLPLGVPGGVIGGYLLRGVFTAGKKLLWRIPLMVAAILGMGMLYELFPGGADDLSEAWSQCWERLQSLFG